MNLARPLTLLAGLLLASAPALGQPKPVANDVLIIGGGKTQADAEKAKAAFVKKVWLLARQKDAAWPQVMVSGDIAGLNPGLFIAVAGICRHDSHRKAEREGAAKAMKALEKASYVRTVKGSIGDFCPSAEMLGAGAPEEAKLRAAVDKAANGKNLVAYAVFLKEQGRLEEARQLADEAATREPDNAEAKSLAELLMTLMTD